MELLQDLVKNWDSVGISKVYPLLKIGVALVGAATIAYVARTTLGPLALGVRWMFGTGEIAEGVAHGARLMVWAALIGGGLWFITN
jgi:hypothetical protein